MKQFDSFKSQRAMQIAAINMAAMLTIFVLLAAYTHGPWDTDCVGRRIDFQALWAAARLAYLGEPLAAFDPIQLRDVYSYCDIPQAAEKYWLYPAPAMLLMLPLGMLPFLGAWLVFSAVSLLLLAAAVKPFCKNNWVVLTLIVFSPAFITALTSGQVAHLWIATLLAALSMLRANRMVLAGILIGLLTLKPTLGLLIPFALVASNSWKTILTATIATAVLHSIATLFYGMEYWSLWFDMTSHHAHEMVVRMSFFDRKPPIASLAYLGTRFGLGVEFAVMCNLVFALVLAAVVFVVWRRLGAKSDISAAILCAAIPLATPYLWSYDAAFTAIAGFFLLRAHQGNISSLWWLFYAACWIGPGLGFWNRFSFNLEMFRYVWTVPTLLLVILVVCIHAAATAPKQHE